MVALFKEVCAYLRTHPRAPGQHDITIGIITFYRGQMEHLRTLLRSFDPIAAEHVGAPFCSGQFIRGCAL